MSTDQSSAVSAAAPAASDGAADPGEAGSGEVSNNTTFSSWGEFREKAPAIYNKMMEGIGMNICSEWRRQQERRNSRRQ